MLHGIVTWGITLLLTFYLLGSAVGGIIGGAFGLVGGAASGAASVASEGLKAAAPQMGLGGVTPEQILDRAKAYLQTVDPDPASMTAEAAQQAIATTMPQLLAGGEQAQQAREHIVTIMAAQLKISPEDAAKRFDEAQAQLTQAKDQAVQTREYGLQGVDAGVYRPGARCNGGRLRRLARGPATCHDWCTDRRQPDWLLTWAGPRYPTRPS